MTQTVIMETLPIDILENIFSRLPIESILQCKRVCKTWRTIVRNNVVGLRLTITENTQSHGTQLYYGDPEYETTIEKYYFENALTPLVRRVDILEPNGMVGSCNGMACYKAVDPLYGKDHGLAFICDNRITGDVSNYIPGLENNGRSLKPPLGGFGYVGATNEYKVVRIYFKYWEAYVQVYTLGSHIGWRDKGIVPGIFYAHESGIFANGAIHWIDMRGYIYTPPIILAFGLANEEFWRMPSPPLHNIYSCNLKLTLLGGNLCVVHSEHESIIKCLDIWVFKKSATNNSTRKRKAKENQPYDHTWKWRKVYHITWEGEALYTPFIVTKRNTVLLWQNGTSNLCCYDPTTSILQKYWDGDERDNVYVQAIPHKYNNVSLEDLGKKLCNDGWVFNIETF